MGFDLKHSTPQKQSTPKTTTSDWQTLLQKEITWFGHFFNGKRKENFYTELGVLLTAGISLKEAIGLLAENQKKQAYKAFLEDMKQQLIAGTSFSTICAQEKAFSTYEQYAIQIGEDSGQLEEICKALGDFYTRRNEQKRQIRAALTYPSIIMCTAFLVLVFMLNWVVPMFEDIFAQNQVSLPPLTQFIISLSAFFQTYGVVVIVLILLIWAALFSLRQNKIWKQKRQQFLSKTPIIGLFLKNNYIAQFVQAMALLVRAKVPIVRGLELTKKMVGYYPLEKNLETAIHKIMAGNSLSESLAAQPLFDNQFISLIRVAEETNQTEFIFERLHQQYQSKLQQQSKTLSTVLEPFIILFIGILVGVILIAMYMPMFELSSVLG
ncbi:MAG: type II secretion system F family protein [Flavobacteriaceae bacterium]|nr:type II secretion system F family protein [Flavobacteriaceae bacterium]